MIAPLDDVTARALSLPLSERARLVANPDPEQEAIDAAWREEIHRRVSEWRDGTVQAIPAEEVLLELERGLDHLP